jgi:CheY-like chemotaxis protein
MIVSTLESMGYDTIASGSGSEALDVVRSHERIDLLFTDVVMPGGLNGTELAHEARRLRPDLLVLLTTGFVALGRDAPVVDDDDLPMRRKPYHQPQSAQKLRDFLRSS